jgi:uncharacterized protein involved in exopolysaccharide biosynthesis
LGRDRNGSHKDLALKKQSLGALGPADDSAVVQTTTGWIQQLNPNWGLTDRDLAIHDLSKRLKITSPRKSNVIVISCDTATPELSRAIVSKMIQAYLYEHTRLNRPAGAHEFLIQQTAGMRERLIASEQALKELKNQTGLAAIDVQRDLLVTRLARLEDETYQTDQELAASEAEVKELIAKLQTMPKTTTRSLTKGAENQASDLMHSRLYDLQVREQELRAKYTDQHPEVIAVREQATAAEKIFTKEPKSRVVETIGPSRPAEEAEVELVRQEPKLASLRARSQVLRNQLKTVRNELKSFNENAQRIVELQRETELQDANYRRYANNLEDAHIDQALESKQISNINVVEPATLNIRPVWPKPWLNLGLGFVVALVGSVGIALAIDSRERASRASDGDATTETIPTNATSPTAHIEPSAQPRE